VSSAPRARARRRAEVVLAWLAGAGGALALREVPPAPATRPDLRVELERTRREQALLRAEGTVRLLRLLTAEGAGEGAGP